MAHTNTEWHSLSSKEALELLSVSSAGLDAAEAERRLQKSGLNELPAKKKINPLKILYGQFSNFLVLMLIFAAVVSFFIGEQFDAIVILAIVVLNAALGFVQEFKAEKAMEALQKLAAVKAVVVRNGEEQEIDAKLLVPGDIVIVREGEKIPADCRVLMSVNLQVDESSLTGESTPVQKTDEKAAKGAAVADRKNMLFMNTVATYGRGSAIVVATGQATEFGKIAKLIQEIEAEKTPLTKKLDGLAEFLGKAVIAIIVALLAIDFAIGTFGAESFLTAIALAVAAVPEGLPAVVTISLAFGMKAMAARNALVRKIVAVETLGSTTVICSDKTGTLTKNELNVRTVFADRETIEVLAEPKGESFLSGGGEIGKEEFGEGLRLLLNGAVLCNNASVGKSNANVGDPTEIALLLMGRKAGVEKDALTEFSFETELAFDSNRKRMTSVFRHKGGRIAFMKGSFESVLAVSTKVLVNGKESADKKLFHELEEKNDEFAADGMRVLAFAYRRLDAKEKVSVKETEKGMTLLGITGMIDIPRQEAREAIAECKSAGIDVKMVTGDHKLTAVAIAGELGIMEEGKIALSGDELEKMSDRELKEKIGRITVFARVSPEHKLRIVDALKANGHVVAMTGDGVNDAPALKKADIGISMGITGTHVAKEASDMVMLDDNFSTIVKAIEEGRKIYSNIKNFVRYLLAANAGEVLVVGVATIAGFFLKGFPIPVLPIHLLWINLVTDGFPALALGNEPLHEDEMKKKPRGPKENILHKMRSTIAVAAILMAIAVLAGFAYYLPQGIEKARTIAFTIFVLFELFFVFNCRSENKTFAELPLLSNKSLLLAVAVSFALQLAVIYTPLSAFFKTTPLGLADWAIAITLSALGLLVPYIARLFAKEKG